MKNIYVILSTCLMVSHAWAEIDTQRAASTVILDENGVRNLRIQTVSVEERDFESTVFAVGRIEEMPSSKSVLSSRISGRVTKLNAFEGDTVNAGDILVEIESRQVGNPPPVISLKAPRSGLVVATHLRLGEPVEPENELLDIVDRSEVWAVAQIPEKEAALISEGTKAYIHIPSLGENLIHAELLRYGVDADREAGTVEGIFQIKNPQLKLRPGMRAEFSIVTGRRSNVMAVPRQAIQGDPANRVLFVKDFELPNAFIKVPVQIGEQNDQFIEVLSGVFPGDEVVTRGSYSLVYAGGGGGVSLKEALDAAHGHEHNEDGSEITDDQKSGSHEDEHEGGMGLNIYLAIYAIIVTLTLFLILGKRKSKKA